MTNDRMHTGPARLPRRQRGAALPWVFFGFLLIAGFFFFTEHRAHVMGALPFLLLALCPVMHLLHNGLGGHSHGDVNAGADRLGSTRASEGSAPASPRVPRPPHQH